MIILPKTRRESRGEDEEMLKEVADVTAQGDGLIYHVGIFRVYAAVAVVAEVADAEDERADPAGLTLPLGRSIIEWHRLHGHAQEIHGESREGLPFHHHLHLANQPLQQAPIDRIPISPEQPDPVTDLPEADSTPEEMLLDVGEDKDDIA